MCKKTRKGVELTVDSVRALIGHTEPLVIDPPRPAADRPTAEEWSCGGSLGFAAKLSGDHDSLKEALRETGAKVSQQKEHFEELCTNLDEDNETLRVALVDTGNDVRGRITCLKKHVDILHADYTARFQKLERQLDRADESAGVLDARLAFERSASKADVRRVEERLGQLDARIKEAYEELDARLNSLDMMFEDRFKALEGRTERALRLSEQESGGYAKRLAALEERAVLVSEEEGADLPTP